MESALVRKDAVMLHDPMGSHKRATVVGVALACVALVGFLVWGLFAGKGSVPQPGSIVIGKDSGSVYVVTADDKAEKRLIPMLNMASAKLLAMLLIVVTVELAHNYGLCGCGCGLVCNERGA